jgi:HEAT repeat protein
MRFQSPLLIALLATSGASTAAPPAAPSAPAVPALPAAPPAAPGSSDRKPDANEELALAALEGLMSQPAERALPIIKKVLAGSQTTLVKKRALFVLSQIHSSEARELLMQQSRSPDAEMRAEAIRSIGIGGDPKSLDALLEIYNGGDERARKNVLQAWLIAGRKEAVYQVAMNAKTDDEAKEAIRILGAMGATDELRKLGDRPKVSAGLVEAYAISGDLASLRKLAESNGDRGVRLEAVRKIGIVHGEEARKALRDIYARADDREIKEAALQGMMIGNDEQGVLALYRAAKTPDEKRALMRTLSTMDGDAALQAIDDALENRK